MNNVLDTDYFVVITATLISVNFCNFVTCGNRFL